MPAADDAFAVSWPRALARNLRAGAAIAMFRAPYGPVGSVGQVAWLAILDLLAAVVSQAALAGFAGSFNWSGVGGALLPAVLFLVASSAICALAGRSRVALALAVGMLAAALWMGIVLTLVTSALADVRWQGAWGYVPWLVWYGGLAWVVAAFAVAASRLLPLSLPGRLAAVAIAGAVVVWPLIETASDRYVWVRAPDPEAYRRQAAVTAAAGEALLYSQPAVLARTLDALLPRKPGRPNLYLVSVAGYAEQDVFMREAVSVDTLFAERFGTRGRSIKLVNSRLTMSDTPLATRTSIADALRRVGAVMDPSEDILFLFLTSHGRPGRFSLAFHPLSLADLTPQELRRMLDDAGIRYRVIVVSACYSGSFVEALRSDDTLVMTASAPDRNSFGCSNEAEFTYFGKAFFDEALRQHGSFTAAFDAALPVIAGREKAEGYDPSLPQRALGANIGSRLAAWEKTLGVGPAPVGHGASAVPGVSR